MARHVRNASLESSSYLTGGGGGDGAGGSVADDLSDCKHSHEHKDSVCAVRKQSGVRRHNAPAQWTSLGTLDSGEARTSYTTPPCSLKIPVSLLCYQVCKCHVATSSYYCILMPAPSEIETYSRGHNIRSVSKAVSFSFLRINMMILIAQEDARYWSAGYVHH
jgi:hypothetical protein